MDSAIGAVLVTCRVSQVQKLAARFPADRVSKHFYLHADAYQGANHVYHKWGEPWTTVPLDTMNIIIPTVTLGIMNMLPMVNMGTISTNTCHGANRHHGYHDRCISRILCGIIRPVHESCTKLSVSIVWWVGAWIQFIKLQGLKFWIRLDLTWRYALSGIDLILGT